MNIQSVNLFCQSLEANYLNTNSIKFIKNVLISFPSTHFVIETSIKSMPSIDISIPYFKDRIALSSFQFDKNKYDNNDNWKKLFSIFNDFENGSFEDIKQIWLEFDSLNMNTVSAPGLYIQVAQIEKNKTRLLLVLKKIFGAKLIENLTPQIEQLSVVQTNKVLNHVGFFFSRNDLAIRFVYLTNIYASNVLLNRFGCREHLLNILSIIREKINMIIGIHFNISDTNIEIQGVEIYESTGNWNDILSVILAEGWCNKTDLEKIVSLEVKLLKTDNKASKPSIKINHLKLINSDIKDFKVYYSCDLA